MTQSTGALCRVSEWDDHCPCVPCIIVTVVWWSGAAAAFNDVYVCSLLLEMTHYTERIPLVSDCMTPH